MVGAVWRATAREILGTRIGRLRLGYWLTLLGVGVLAAVYAERRELGRRYEEYRRNEMEVQTKRLECEALEQRIQASRQRVDSLGNDLLEIEADIRRNKTLVREGEIIYRIEPVGEAHAGQPTPPEEHGPETVPASGEAHQPANGRD